MKRIDTRIGSTLENRYRIDKKIATGGMSVVYAGERLQLGRPVAVKFLHPKLCQDEKFLKRFELEARAMSQLSHPNCISVIDFGISDSPYLVMDLVEGETLKKVLKDGPMATSRVMLIVRQVLAGLANAHKQGIIHRDIKPGNILISEADCSGEHVMVFDFGLAKHLELTGEDLTGKGIVAGTAEYLAPENTGRNGGKITLDERTDLFSVGVVAYEMLTGKRPFSPPSAMEIWKMHDEPPLPLSKAFPEGDFPAGLEKIIAKALARNPNKRYQTAEEFVAAVDDFLEAEGIRHRSVVPPPEDSKQQAASSLTPVVNDIISRKKSLFIVGAPLLVLALVGFGIGIFVGTNKNRENDNPPAPIAADSTPMARKNSPKATSPEPPTHLPQKSPPVAATPGAQTNSEEDPPTNNEANPESSPTANQEVVGNAGEIQTLKEDDPEELAFVMYLIGNGDTEKAIEKLNEAAARFPMDGHIHLLLGNLYSEQKQQRNALDSYRHAIRLQKSNRRNKVLIGNAVQFLDIDSMHAEVSGFIENEIGKAGIPALKKALEGDLRPKFAKRIGKILQRLSENS